MKEWTLAHPVLTFLLVALLILGAVDTGQRIVSMIRLAAPASRLRRGLAEGGEMTSQLPLPAPAPPIVHWVGEKGVSPCGDDDPHSRVYVVARYWRERVTCPECRKAM